MISTTITLIEKSGTGIGKSGAVVEKSGTGIRLSGAIIVLFITSLFWGTTALAVQGSGGGTTSTGTTVTPPSISKDEGLATVTFRDGYRVINGYGHIEKDYAQVSLYSLEYVHVINSGDDLSQESILVQGSGGGTASEGDVTETAPVQGSGGGGASEGSNNDQLKAWGIAEVVLSERGIADIIVYRFNEEGTLEEVGVYSGVEVH